MATPAERLVEAEAAYHALSLGRAAVQITDQNGESIRYSPANASRLKEYIADLKALIAGTSRIRAPMRPIFL